MMNLAEYRRSTIRLADFLPWAALVDEGVVLNKDGSFQRTARFRGPDLDSAVLAELVAVAGRINNAFRRLGSGWAIFVEAQRHSAGRYPISSFPDGASALVDAERKAEFEEEGAHYESSYFLTLLYLPPPEDAARAERFLYEGRERTENADAREILRGFVDRTDRVLQLVEGFMPESRWLDDAETLTYLHSCISTNRQRVRVPEVPMYLDALLADQPLTGGLEPMLGNAHLRVLTIVGFPSATTPGLLEELSALAFAYRWSTRAIMLDKTDATRLLAKIRRQWFAKRKSIAAILKEVMTNEASALVDTDAHNKAMDADAALQELGSDLIGEAYVTATVTVWHEDSRIADERLRLVEKLIQGRDFTCMVETVNAVDAWLGSLPGHVYANVRQAPLSTLNIAHMIPLSAVWAGPAIDEHFKAPPLFFARTEGSTPFRFSLHVGDVGHTLVVGPTGAGKSVLLALMALQFRRYDGAQVFAFDFGGSIRAAALAMGGDWHDLGGALSEDGSEPVALQPLALMAIYTFVFSHVAKVNTNGTAYPAFVFCGLLPWIFFSGSIGNAVNGMVAYPTLLTKMYFPREIIPLSYLAAGVVDFVIASVILVGMLAFYRVQPTWNVLYVFPILIVLGIFAAAVALFFAAVHVRFRDVGLALPFVLQIWMFATPVVYSLQAVPQRVRSLYLLDPVAGAIDAFRAAILYGHAPDVRVVSLTAGLAILSLLLAYAYFKASEAAMADLV